MGGAWVIHSTTRPSSNPPAHAHPLDPQDMSIRLASPPATSPPLTPATQAISTDGVGRLTSLLSLLPHGPLKYSHTVPGRLWPSKRMGSVYGRSESRILAFVAATSLRNPLLPTAHCKQRRLVWTALHMAAQRVQGRLKRGGPGQAEAIADCVGYRSFPHNPLSLPHNPLAGLVETSSNLASIQPKATTATACTYEVVTSTRSSLMPALEHGGQGFLFL